PGMVLAPTLWLESEPKNVRSAMSFSFLTHARDHEALNGQRHAAPHRVDVPQRVDAPHRVDRGLGRLHEIDFAGFRPGTIDPAPEPPRVRAPVDAIKARIRRYNAELSPDSGTFRAAVLLLLAYDHDHNVERLARRTGYPRAFVAKVA